MELDWKNDYSQIQNRGEKTKIADSVVNNVLTTEKSINNCVNGSLEK